MWRRFSIRVDGVVFPDTSTPQACVYETTESTPESHQANPQFSSGAYNLNAGAHILNVAAIVRPYPLQDLGVSLRIIPRAPDPVAVQPVPTLSQWSLLLLSALAAGFGAMRLKRRRAV